MLLLLLLLLSLMVHDCAAASSQPSSSSIYSATSRASKLFSVDDDQQRAFFVFGDSLVDAGNNNFLPQARAKVYKYPYGIDFPTPNANHPTGRFTNGYTVADIVSIELGGRALPQPFLNPTTKGQVLLNGVNYASGAGGILNETGRPLGPRLSFDVQLGYFEETIGELRAMLGEGATERLLSTSIFSVTMGANDFIINYLLPYPGTRDFFLSLSAFLQKLITRYKSQLTRLYHGGARRVVVVNVPAIGCAPYERSINVGSNGSCNGKLNQYAQNFNALLKPMLSDLNVNLPGAHFIYADAYGAGIQVINNPHAYGLEDAEKACCGFGGAANGLLVVCNAQVSLCPDRSKYLYWDAFHPTQAANQLLAHEFIDGSQFISPISIRQLTAL